MGHTETYVDGVWYPSVSTIIHAEPKPWLQAWKDKWGVLAERKVEIASAIGSEFHRCVEDYLNFGLYTVRMATGNGIALHETDKRILGMMRSFVGWAKHIDGNIHDTELKVISRKYHYSGTLDAVGTFNGKPMLYDWKTSSRVHDSMQLQLVAYAQAYYEQTGIKLKEGMIVHVSKDKPHFKLTIKVFKLGKKPLAKFLKLRAMFNEMQVPQ